MSIAVVNTNHGLDERVTGEFIRKGSLAITGLSEGANEVLHGLPFIPRRLSFRPGAAGLWGETSAPDSTKIYITVGTGGATAGTVDYEE